MAFLNHPEVLGFNYAVNGGTIHSNEDVTRFDWNDARDFVILLGRSIEAPGDTLFEFSTGDSNPLVDAWDRLLQAEKAGKPVSMKPNAPQIIRAVWSKNRDACPVAPSIVLDTGENVWLLHSVANTLNTLIRLHRTFPGFNPMGSLPVPGINARIAEKSPRYYPLEDLEAKQPEPPKNKEAEDVDLGFVDQGVSDIRDTFDSFEAKHSPSDDHWRGLREIVENVDGQINGSLEPKFFLSSLPTGMGKTTALIQSVRLARRRYPEKSWLIFLNQIDEIDRLVEAMNLDETDYACLTSRETTNAKGLGSKNARSAPVLFTCQKRLENAALRQREKNKGFAEMPEFWFNGRPRDIRAWDEAILPSMALTLDEQAMYGLLSQIPRVKHSRLYGDLKSWHRQLEDYSDGSVIIVPDLEEYGLATVDEFSAIFPEEQEDAANALWLLSGRTVRVRKDPLKGMTCLDYINIIPDDLAPLLILDASGGIRKSYEDWEQRGTLVRLHAPTKRYPIVIRIHDMAAGKGAQGTKSSQSAIIDRAITVLNAENIPNKLFASYLFKPGRIDWPHVLKARFYGDVDCCHWGAHTGTNKFQKARHIVIVGLYVYNLAAHEAQARGSRQMALEDDITVRDLDEYISAEVMHNLFQLIGRGAVRRCIGDSCPPGIVVDIIATTRKNGRLDQKLLAKTFPGATIEVVKPDREPKGRVKEALDAICAGLKARQQVYFSEVRKAIGVDRKDFQRDIVEHYTFADGLRRIKVHIVYQGAGTKGSYFTWHG